MILTLKAPSPPAAPTRPSTLDTEETSAQFDSQPTYGACLRRSCYPEFLAAEQVYEELDHLRVRKRAQVLRACRSIAWFVRHDLTGEVQVASSSCKLRWCPVCARSHRNFIACQVKPWLDESDHPKFITLTLKHSNAPLDHQLTHLYKYFRELRRRKDFRNAVTGGIWFFHIKRSKDDGLWHPHLHCLVTGLYIPKSRLRRLWVEVTCGSFIVGIRSVQETEKAASESARYAAAPASLAGMCLADRVELVECLHGKRICGTWGTGRQVSLRPEPLEDPHRWTSLGSWQYVNYCRDSNRNAEAILHAWHCHQPLPEGIYCFVKSSSSLLDPNRDWVDYDFDKYETTERSPP